MPIASLSRFTVPISGSQASTTQGLLMPKLKYRFRVTLDSFGVPGQPTTELTKQVMNVSRPEVSFEEIKLPVYNSTVKLLAKNIFAIPKLIFLIVAVGFVSVKEVEKLQKQFDFFEQASAASGIDYKFTSRIEMLDGGNGASTPNVLETFELYGCYLESTNYNTLNYATSEDVTIALTIRYDNAIQSPQGTGIGTAVGRTINTAITGGGAI